MSSESNTRRRSNRTRRVAVVGAALAGTMIIPGTALAADPGPNPSDAAASGSGEDVRAKIAHPFHVVNNSQLPAATAGRVGWPVGERRRSVLEPGGSSLDWTVTFFFFEPNQVRAKFAVLDLEGRQVSELTVSMNVLDIVSFQTITCSPGGGVVCRPNMDGDQSKTLSDTATVLDPAGTVNNVPASDPGLQAAAMTQLCVDGNRATCDVDPTHRERTTSPLHRVGDVALVNNTNEQKECQIAVFETVSGSPTIPMQRDSRLVLLLRDKLLAGYGDYWDHDMLQRAVVTVKVPPRSMSWVATTTPLITFGGTATMKLGDTVWKLTGVPFQMADWDRQMTPELQSRQLTAQEQADLPPTFNAPEYVHGVL